MSLNEQVFRWKQLREQLHRDPTKHELRAEIALLSAGDQPGLTKDNVIAAFEHGILVRFPAQLET